MENVLALANMDCDGDDFGCHLTWVERNAVPDEIFETSKEQCNLWFEMKRRDQHVPLFDIFGYFFNKAVFANWDGNDIEAEKWIQEAEDKLNTESDLPLYHFQAFRYIVQANRAVLKSGQDFSTYEHKINIEDPRCQAIILCMKALFIGLFGEREGRLKLFRQVIKLDLAGSDYYWRNLFLALRQLRRERCPPEYPSVEEIEIMEKALVLSSDHPYNLQCMTKLYLDIIKANEYNSAAAPELSNKLAENYRRGKDTFVLQMQKYAKKAYKLNPDSQSSALLLAEVLCIGRDGSSWSPETEQLIEAEEIYRRCVKDFGQINSEALHKAGIFFCKIKHDRNTGLELILQGLKVEPANFPALMDYLRYSGQNLRQQDNEALYNLIEFIDNHIPLNVLRKQLCSKLYVLKAVLLTKTSNFDEALEAWMKAMDLCPELSSKDTVLLGKKVFRCLLQVYDYKLLRAFIKDQIRMKPLDSGRLVHLKALMETVDRVINPPPNNSNTSAVNQSDSDRRGASATTTRTRIFDSAPSVSSSFGGRRRNQTNYHYRQPAPTVSDLDDNWRR